MRGFNHPAIEDVALEQVFHALSDPLRLAIVCQLARTPEASCSELTAGRPKSSMSHHFRVLREAGLVRTRAQGTAHANALRREELDRRFPGLIDALIGSMVEDARGLPNEAGREQFGAGAVT